MAPVKSAIEHTRAEFQELRIKQQAYFHALENLEVGMREIGLLDPTENLRRDGWFVGLTWKEFRERIDTRKDPDQPRMFQKLTNWCAPLRKP